MRRGDKPTKLCEAEARCCIVQGCGRTHYGLGLCKAHLAQFHRHGKITNLIIQRRPKVSGTCSHPGCERPIKKAQLRLCELHYRRVFKAEREEKCSVDGCERPLHSRGMCMTHYSRWYRYGSPDIVNRWGQRKQRLREEGVNA